MENPFRLLVGQQLNAVSFVMDYVEFHFNGPVLRSLTAPIVEIGSQQFRFPDVGSRDAFCSCIGATVSRADLISGKAIKIGFDAGAGILIPLDQAHCASGESAHFIPEGEGRVMVW